MAVITKRHWRRLTKVEKAHRAEGIVIIGILLLTGSLLTQGQGIAAAGGFPLYQPQTGQHRDSGQTVVNGQDLGDDRIVTAGLGVRTADTSFFLIRSYDAHTGEVISEDEFALTIDEETASSLEKGGGRIYAVGSGLNADGDLSLLVRAYDAVTGDLLWEDELNRSKGQEGRAAAFKTTLEQRIAAPRPEIPSQPQSKSTYHVRAIDTRTGRLVWEDEFLTNRGKATQQTVPPVLEQGAFSERNFSVRVRTFEAETGTLLWEDQLLPKVDTGEGREDEAGLERGQPQEEELNSNQTEV